ncbi:MAG TPA: hypothetical protein VHC63_13335 [Acidimicrobiales bacterium]|nr:hypothetical protein [Acidimicrobiales bacterium]
MKIRWIAEPRGLADPQLEVKRGQIVDVDDDVAASLIDQGLAEPAAAGAKAATPGRKPKSVSAETPVKAAPAAADKSEEGK